MDCPHCQTSNAPEQKFCGSCGRKLESSCAQCGAANPPHYQFCGQCGARLFKAGAITLANSGLITQADQTALDMLGYQAHEMEGKPFSLFIKREDLVVFFSNLNEWHKHFQKQSFEILLTPKNGKSSHLQVLCSIEKRSPHNAGEIRLLLGEIPDQRLSSAQMQYQQDLINLVFALSDNISTVSDQHFDQTLQDALKLIGLFTQSDRSFIYGINRRLQRLEPAYEWCQTHVRAPAPDRGFKSVPLAMIKRAIVRLRQEKSYVVDDVTKLPPSERYELLAWHQSDPGAVICHLIYCSKRPVGIIGVAKNSAEGQWSQECVGLVKFFGQIVSERLPFSAAERKYAARAPSARKAAAKDPTESKANANVINIDEKRPPARDALRESSKDAFRIGSAPSPGALPHRTRPMMLEPVSERRTTHQQTVVARDDGLVLLTCPLCGLQESVSLSQFDKIGNAVQVNCPCSRQFTAVLEKRHAFRKPVHLEGYFTLQGDLGAHDAEGSIWGTMVVEDLSKAGLRFSSAQSSLVHPNDFIMVRFNLDNSNRALIHKAAKVISAAGNEVGCQFVGSDSYDVTLGFYFI